MSTSRKQRHRDGAVASLGPMKTAIAALALVGLLLGCGNGGFVFISFTSGVIENDPSCSNNGGQFHLREATGLTVLVVLKDSSSIILAGGHHGTCGDLHANTSVGVRGSQQGERVTAQTVTVQ